MTLSQIMKLAHALRQAMYGMLDMRDALTLAWARARGATHWFAASAVTADYGIMRRFGYGISAQDARNLRIAQDREFIRDGAKPLAATEGNFIGYEAA